MAAEGTILDDSWFFADDMGLDLHFGPARGKKIVATSF